MLTQRVRHQRDKGYLWAHRVDPAHPGRAFGNNQFRLSGEKVTRPCRVLNQGPPSPAYRSRDLAFNVAPPSEFCKKKARHATA